MKSVLLMLWGRRHGEKAQVARSATEGEVARKEAEAALRKAKASTPYYQTLSDDLRSLRERNHFADNIRATVKGA